MAINQVDVKKLFSLSAGQCNICKQSVIEGEVIIGEMAHIVAKSSNGPRGDENRPQDNSYDNLILLCSNDHKKVDSRPLDFSIEKLRLIKYQHEADIAKRLNRNKEYEQDLSSLNLLFEFIPFRSLRSMAMGLPHKLSIKFEVTDTFYHFQEDNPHLYPFWDKELTQFWEAFLSAICELDNFLLSNISGNIIYPLGEFSEDCNHNCFNIYVSDDDRFMVMNKRNLKDEQIGLVEGKVSPLLQSFIYSHTNLVNYIRHNFSNIRW